MNTNQSIQQSAVSIQPKQVAISNWQIAKPFYREGREGRKGRLNRRER
jgi:hypothetical protein